MAAAAAGALRGSASWRRLANGGIVAAKMAAAKIKNNIGENRNEEQSVKMAMKI
jgi:hypothetical protein